MTIKPIAMYLPQYHPIPENDAWWGNGFTEWTNVTRGTPQFQCHYQPHVPGTLGYYDLRDPSTQTRQAALARQYGIYGFCYYHYWFDGKRLLETPLNTVLSSGQPDFPFCVCWANESWTRQWDGRNRDILIAQNYSDGFDARFINNLLPVLADPRYIQVDGKPLLLVYRPDKVPDIRRVADTWRELASRHGLGGLFLAAVQSFDIEAPNRFGFDAAVEFPPHCEKGLNLAGLMPKRGFRGKVFDYRELVCRQLLKCHTEYLCFRGAMPAWDNTARRGDRSTVFVESSAEWYEAWLTAISHQTRRRVNPDHHLIFLNAWNEWAEGAHLEPDQRFGYAYLTATRNAIEGSDSAVFPIAANNEVEVNFDQGFPENVRRLLTAIEADAERIVDKYGSRRPTARALLAFRRAIPHTVRGMFRRFVRSPAARLVNLFR